MSIPALDSPITICLNTTRIMAIPLAMSIHSSRLFARLSMPKSVVDNVLIFT